MHTQYFRKHQKTQRWEKYPNLTLLRKFWNPLHITFVCNDYKWLIKRQKKNLNSSYHVINPRGFVNNVHETHLVSKQWLNISEELHLLIQAMPTLLRHIHHVEHGSAQMCQGSDSLHLNGVPVLQGVIQNTRGVYHLKLTSLSQVLLASYCRTRFDCSSILTF